MCRMISFKVLLTEKQSRQFVGMKIYDVDGKTILGSVSDYDHNNNNAVIALTTEGEKIFSEDIGQNPRIGWSVEGNYIPKNNEQKVVEFISSHKN